MNDFLKTVKQEHLIYILNIYCLEKCLMAAVYSYSLFKNTKIVNNIGLLKSLKYKNSNRLSTKIYSEIVINHLTDCVLITSCFENFIKALLLYNGYVIHLIDQSKNSDLYKKQRKEPIHINDINKVDINLLRSLKIETLGISTISRKEKYINASGIDETFLKDKQRYFKYRNNVHFYPDIKVTFPSDEYDRVINMIDFVNNNIVRFANNIIENYTDLPGNKLEKIKY